MRKRYNFLYPALFALILALGMILGTRYFSTSSANDGNTRRIDPNEKIGAVLSFINGAYVEKENMSEVAENAIRGMLEKLDPHSSYIPAKQLKAMNEPLEGNFDGIGVEFNIIRDTITVVSPISGGPSEELGIRAGDQIIKVEGKTVAGTGISNQQVVERLRGKRGTKVEVSIRRPGKKKLMEFTIVRDEIPIYSVIADYMIDEKTGYLKLSRFSAKTSDEIKESLTKLKQQGLENLILDLRGNPGGFLTAANDLADEFLRDQNLIVYTEGAHSPKVTYKATKEGLLEEGKLVILIDEGSASASEIVSGAVQDHDRGLLVGRRTFGKGLVQEPFQLGDGSVIRLTVARYHTPSGRCIQKEYDNGVDSYNRELLRRFEKGEYTNKDSIEVVDSLKYKTSNGRTVYGGGGVVPDYFVPLDTSGGSEYLNKLLSKGLINSFALDFVNKYRNEFKQNYKSLTQFSSRFKVQGVVLDRFITYAARNGVPYNREGVKKSRGVIINQLKALVARQFWNNDGYHRILNENNDAYKKATELIMNDSAFYKLNDPA